MPARVLPLVFHGKAGPTRRNVQVDRLVVAGWTGRDKAALEKHIAELEALGVKRAGERCRSSIAPRRRG